MAYCSNLNVKYRIRVAQVSLAQNAAADQKDVIVTDTKGFYLGQSVLIADSVASESNVVASIDESTKTLTMTTNLANTYTTAQSALVSDRTYDTEIDDCIVQADAFIDDSMKEYETVPLNPVPTTIANISADLAAGIFASRRNPDDAKVSLINLAQGNLLKYIRQTYYQGELKD